MSIFNQTFRNEDLTNTTIQKRTLLKAYITKILNDEKILKNDDLRSLVNTLLENVKNDETDLKINSTIEYISILEYYIGDYKTTAEIFSETFQEIIKYCEKYMIKKYSKFKTGISGIFKNISQIIHKLNKSRCNYIQKLWDISSGDYKNYNGSDWTSIFESIMYTMISFGFIYFVNYYTDDDEETLEDENMKRKLEDNVLPPSKWCRLNEVLNTTKSIVDEKNNIK